MKHIHTVIMEKHEQDQLWSGEVLQITPDINLQFEVPQSRVKRLLAPPVNGVVVGLDCPECKKVCRSIRGLGIHRSTMHGVKGKRSK